MITLSHLRALLERALTHTSNPAILRLPKGERTVVGLAKAYLSRTVWFDSAPHPGPDGFHSPHREVFNDRVVGCLTYNSWMRLPVDLTEPGTTHALLVTLALALGLDPGVGGLDVKWGRMMDARTVFGSDANPRYMDYALFSPSLLRSEMLCGRQYLAAPIVAAEPDPIKALTVAVHHVLENP